MRSGGGRRCAWPAGRSKGRCLARAGWVETFGDATTATRSARPGSGSALCVRTGQRSRRSPSTETCSRCYHRSTYRRHVRRELGEVLRRCARGRNAARRPARGLVPTRRGETLCGRASQMRRGAARGRPPTGSRSSGAASGALPSATALGGVARRRGPARLRRRDVRDLGAVLRDRERSHLRQSDGASLPRGHHAPAFAFTTSSFDPANVATEVAASPETIGALLVRELAT